MQLKTKNATFAPKATRIKICVIIQIRGCEEKEDQFLLDFTAPSFLVKNSETRKKRKQPPPRGATSIFMQKIATLPPGVGSVCYRICRGYVR